MTEDKLVHITPTIHPPPNIIGPSRSRDLQSIAIRCSLCQWKFRRPFGQWRAFCRACEDKPLETIKEDR